MNVYEYIFILFFIALTFFIINRKRRVEPVGIIIQDAIFTQNKQIKLGNDKIILLILLLCIFMDIILYLGIDF